MYKVPLQYVLTCFKVSAKPFQMYCTVYTMYLLYLDVLYIWIKYCLHYKVSLLYEFETRCG